MIKMIPLLIIFIFVVNSLGQEPCIKEKPSRVDGRTTTDVSSELIRSLQDLAISEDGKEVFVSGRKIEITESKVFSYGLIWRRGRGDWKATKIDFLNWVDQMQWKNSQTGWIGGVFQTTDGGKSWKLVAEDALEFFFLDSGTGWYSATDPNVNRILRDSKHQVLTKFDDQIEEMTFVTREVGWIHFVRFKPDFLTTRDGGKSWKSLEHPAARQLKDFQFLNPDEGYMLTPTAVFRTRDGGNSWKDLGLKNGKGLAKIFFLDSKHGWAVGDNSCRTSNGGLTWRCSKVPCAMITNAVEKNLVFRNTREGWMLTTNALYETRNAGKTWRRKYLTYQGQRF